VLKIVSVQLTSKVLVKPKSSYQRSTPQHMSSFLVTTLLLQSAQLQWANHPLRMSGPDNTTHVRLDGGTATPITFVHNLLDFTGEGV
jgi:hypothetical protein